MNLTSAKFLEKDRKKLPMGAAKTPTSLARTAFILPLMSRAATTPAQLVQSSMSDSSIHLPGLTARLDKLSHYCGGPHLPREKPHAFVYFITITNASDHTVTLLGRKWMIENADGTREIVEGDKIVGEIPRLAPGESFSYNSCHMTSKEGVAHGCFHGIDDRRRRIHVPLAPFALRIPSSQPSTEFA